MTASTYGLMAMALYFVALLSIAHYRSKSATLDDYLIGGHASTWWLITIGMISDSISGVTYVSVPGSVSTQQYSYLQFVLGNFCGYWVIAFVLLPLFYRLNLISIYTYLLKRFGTISQKTGACFFVVSRLFASSARLYIAVLVLHQFFFADHFSPVFSFGAALALIVLYTYKGGIKSLVWTEAFQSVFLLLGLGAIFYALWTALPEPMASLTHPQIFFWDPLAKNFFLKQFIGGLFITIASNGLDQNIMQMNLSCKNTADAQKNMIGVSFVVLLVSTFFIGMGALGTDLAHLSNLNIPSPDRLLSTLTFQKFSTATGILFILGLTAATFSSASTVLPALASSFEIDILPEKFQKRIPVRALHVGAAILMFGVICGFYLVHTKSLIEVIFRLAGYTYGPLLGLFGIGILTRLQIKETWVPVAAVFSILMTALLDQCSVRWFHGYQVSVELILINAVLFAVFIFIATQIHKHLKPRNDSLLDRG